VNLYPPRTIAIVVVAAPGEWASAGVLGRKVAENAAHLWNWHSPPDGMTVAAAIRKSPGWFKSTINGGSRAMVYKLSARGEQVRDEALQRG
jgi:hypothetical protein